MTDYLRCVTTVILFAILAAACGSPTLTPSGGGLVLAELSMPGETTSRRDPVQLRAARITGDRLEVDVTYGGGCREHRFALTHDGTFAESYPVQTGLTLFHDADGDACRALLNRTLEFNLAPLRAAYRAAYGEGPGIIAIHLHGPIPGPDSTISFRWEF
jgi:hypothetical protein